MDKKIRVFIADDHAVVRKGLEALIDAQPNMKVVGAAVDGQDALQQIPFIQPDVILLDIQMPRKTGLEVITELKTTMPHAKILVLTSFSYDDTIMAAIKSGAMGYLLKDSSPQDLIDAIEHANNGRSYLHPDITHKVIQELNKPAPKFQQETLLTDREVEVLQFVAKGLTNQQIAEQLIVTERTVRTHITNILSKLELENRTQATLYALKNGLATLDDA